MEDTSMQLTADDRREFFRRFQGKRGEVIYDSKDPRLKQAGFCEFMAPRVARAYAAGDTFGEHDVEDASPDIRHPGEYEGYYGTGPFEGRTARKGKNGRIFMLDPSGYFDRMDATLTELPYTRAPRSLFVGACQDLVRACADFVPDFGGGYFYLRPWMRRSGVNCSTRPIRRGEGVLQTEGQEFLVLGFPCTGYLAGEIGAVVEFKEERTRRARGWMKLPENYLWNRRVTELLHQYGMVVFLRPTLTGGPMDWHITEGDTGNFWWVNARQELFTPPAEIGQGDVLAGRTANLVGKIAEHRGFTVHRDWFTLRDVAQNAVEIFFTGSAAGVKPCRSLEYGGAAPLTLVSGKQGSVTLRLQKEFLDYASGEWPEDPFGLLELVEV